MEINGYSKRARKHAEFLIRRMDSQYPDLRGQIRELGAVAAVEMTLGITIRIVDRVTPGCSVAGSSNASTRTVSIICSAGSGMPFTVLHEVAHIEGADDDDFQQALSDAPKSSRRDVEEDACEAFAAQFLLPDDRLEPVLSCHGLTARGLVEMYSALPNASREACSVAMAHRLASPGYVALISLNGSLIFAARSGDVFPLARGSSQVESDLAPLFKGDKSTLRTRGVLCFPRGSSTDLHYMDACVDGNTIAVVAVVDSPDWKVLHQPDRIKFADKMLSGYCLDCSIEFESSSRCSECGDALHGDCGRCGCIAPPTLGQRVCTKCYISQPSRMYANADANECLECE